jgi:hypothetical protein
MAPRVFVAATPLKRALPRLARARSGTFFDEIATGVEGETCIGPRMKIGSFHAPLFHLQPLPKRVSKPRLLIASCAHPPQAFFENDRTPAQDRPTHGKFPTT